MSRAEAMTSLLRVLATLGFKEPDRVPLFLLVTMHGARELGLTIEDYFSKAEHVVEGQLRMRARYGHDCLYNFFYAPIEVEAWGGEVIYADDGPPNSGQPLISDIEDILRLEPPDVFGTPCLTKVLRSAEGLKRAVGDEAPIIGVVMSPFSLPVMQLGFARYLELLYERRDLFDRLMAVNVEFCVAWANAQLAAGSTAICYFDPVSSPTIVPRELYLETGFEVACKTLSQIKGPTATHLASGRALPILGDLARTGTAIVGASALEEAGEVKAACQGRLTMLGNLNGIEMRRWTDAEVEATVKALIARAGPGGGFILSDNHGEIPLQVPEPVLDAIAEAVREWGRYPLELEELGVS